MKKYIPIIAVAAILIGNIAVSKTEKQTQIEHSLELNSEFSEHYEMMLTEEERNEQEKRIIREGYRGFLISTMYEYYEYDVEAKHPLMESQ